MTGTTFLGFERLRSRRLAQTRVVLGDDRPAALAGVTSRVTLGYALLVLNAVPIEARVPVLAVGSNASISQMQRKFATAGISSVMPLTWAQVTGVRVGVAAMISRWGYVPRAGVRAGVTSRLALNWLDPEQLAPWTRPSWATTAAWWSTATACGWSWSRAKLAGCGIYVPRRVLADPEGKPMDLPREQRQLIETLLSRPAARKLAGGDADAFVTAATDRQRRAALTEALLASEAVPVVSSTGLPGPAIPRPTPQRGRARRPPVRRRAAVAPSPDNLDRRGEPTVAVSPPAGPSWAGPATWSCGRAWTRWPRRRWGRSSRSTPTRCWSTGAIRNGIGVEIGEHVTLAPAGVAHHHVADLLLSTPHSLLCRVQQAELVRPSAGPRC
jgi:hypothetical protein